MTEVRRHTRKTASGTTARVRQHHRRGGDGEDRGREVAEPERGTAYVGDMQPAAAPADVWAEDDAPPPGDWWADDEPDDWGGNYAAPGAHVGMQARDVVIGGGIFMGGDDGPRVAARPSGPVTPVQTGTRNVAGGGDVVGVQAGRTRETRHSSEHSPAERRMFGTDTPEGAASFDRGADLREVHGWSGAMDNEGRIPDPDNRANAWFMDTMKPAERQACRDKRAELAAEFRGRVVADKHRPDRCRDSMCERLPCVWYKAGYLDGYDDGARMAAQS